MERKIENIVIIGSGNVATHLALSLHELNYNIAQIFSRTQKNAETLARKVDAQYTSNLANILPNADLYILSVKDDTLPILAQHEALHGKTLVHTAGSVPASIFGDTTQKFGVLYPFQTFSKARSVDFKNIPILVEASNKKLEEALLLLANTLSEKAILANSKERAMLHVAAVFACNFTNHMYAIAQTISQENNLPFELLKPLIKETAEKIELLNPKDVQTGPAVRFDNTIIEQHIAQLKPNEEFSDIYALLSKSIQTIKQQTNE